MNTKITTLFLTLIMLSCVPGPEEIEQNRALIQKARTRQQEYSYRNIKIPEGYRMAVIKYNQSTMKPRELGTLIRIKKSGEHNLISDNIELISYHQNKTAKILIPGELSLFTNHPGSRYLLIGHGKTQGSSKSPVLKPENALQFKKHSTQKLPYTLPFTISGLTPGKDRAIFWSGKADQEKIFSLIIPRTEITNITQDQITLTLHPRELLQLLTLYQRGHFYEAIISGTINPFLIHFNKLLPELKTTHPLYISQEEITSGIDRSGSTNHQGVIPPINTTQFLNHISQSLTPVKKQAIKSSPAIKKILPETEVMITLPPLCNAALFQQEDRVISPLFNHVITVEQSTSSALMLKGNSRDLLPLLILPRTPLLAKKQGNDLITALQLPFKPHWLTAQKSIDLIGIHKKYYFGKGTSLARKIKVNSIKDRCLTIPVSEKDYPLTALVHQIGSIHPLLPHPEIPSTTIPVISTGTILTGERLMELDHIRRNTLHSLTPKSKEWLKAPVKNSSWLTLNLKPRNRYQLQLITPGDFIDIIITTTDPNTKQKFAFTMLEKVQVIHHNTQKGEITLELLPEEQLMLQLATELGEFAPSLRSSNDIAPLQDKGRVTIETILTGERIMELANIRRATVQKPMIIKGGGPDGGSGSSLPTITRSPQINQRTMELSNIRRTTIQKPSIIKNINSSTPSSPKKKIQKKIASRSWRSNDLKEHQVTLFVGEKEQLPLKGERYHIRIDGFRARIIRESFFENPHNQQLEGQFKLKLPPGATPFMLAFGGYKYTTKERQLTRDHLPFYRPIDDEQLFQQNPVFNGVKFARFVSREQAHEAYRQTVNRRVDPAILEWSGSDIFDIKVYPILPGKMARIVIGYDFDLRTTGNRWQFHLPLPAPSIPARIDLDLAAKGKLIPTLLPDKKTTVNQNRIRTTYTNDTTRSITITYPVTALKLQNDTYFAFATTLKPGSLTKTPPKKVLFLLDSSLSAAENFQHYRNAIATLLQSKQFTHFNLLFFDIGTRWYANQWQPVSTHQKLLKTIDQTTLVGATSLEAPLRALKKDEALKDERYQIILLTDGAITLGQKRAIELQSHLPYQPISILHPAQSTGNITLLQQLARSRSGEVIPLENDLSKLTTRLREQGWFLEKIIGGEDTLLRGDLRWITPQKTTLYGRGNPDHILLSLKHEKQHNMLLLKPEITLSSPLATRAYGVNSCNLLTQLIEDRPLKSYGLHFGIPGRAVSLLMLESEWDYRRFNIKKADESNYVANHPVTTLLTPKPVPSIREQIASWITQIPFPDNPVLQLFLQKIPLNQLQVLPEAVSGENIPHFNPGQIFNQINKHHNEPAKAIRIATSILESGRSAEAELQTAFEAIKLGYYGIAYELLQSVQRKRPREPLALMLMGDMTHKLKKPLLSILLHELLITTRWDQRFEMMYHYIHHAFSDLLSHTIKSNQPQINAFLDLREKSLQLRKNPIPDRADLVISLIWSTDSTDIDLHIKEPGGEVCYYGNKKTKQGGNYLNDNRGGYGPEIYYIKDAQKGNYDVILDHFRGNRFRKSEQNHLLLAIYRHRGTPKESVAYHTFSINKDTPKKQKVLTITID